MNLDDLNLNSEHELVKSHSCSGRMERRYSEQLCDLFDEYKDFLCNVFEVGDISFINVWKKRFGFIEQGSEFYELLLSNEKFTQIIGDDETSFTGHVCRLGDVTYVVVVWLLQKNRMNPVIYIRKKEELLL